MGKVKDQIDEYYEEEFDEGIVILNDIIQLTPIQYDEYTTYIEESIFENFSSRRDEVDIAINSNDVEQFTISYSNLLTNLIILRPFNRFSRKMTKSFLFDATQFNSKTINSYFNKLINQFVDCDFKELSKIISTSIRDLSSIAGKSNVLIGNSISLYGIIEVAENNPEIDDLFHTHIPNNLELHEIESYLKKRVDRTIEILKDDPTTMFYDYLNSGTGINIKQFGQLVVNIGLKPDLKGNVVPVPSDTNYLLGMNNIQQFFIDAIGARKA